MKLNELLKHKPARIAFGVVCILFSAYCIHGFVDLVHQTHARAVMREYVAAFKESQKTPPGIERAEFFVKRLKAIDPGYAPADVKDALHDYINAIEQGLDALKAGRDTKPYDDAMANAKERLVECAKKWD